MSDTFKTCPHFHRKTKGWKRAAIWAEDGLIPKSKVPPDSWEDGPAENQNSKLYWIAQALLLKGRTVPEVARNLKKRGVSYRSALEIIEGSLCTLEYRSWHRKRPDLTEKYRLEEARKKEIAQKALEHIMKRANNVRPAAWDKMVNWARKQGVEI